MWVEAPGVAAQEPCHPLTSKRDGPGDRATRLGSEIHQEAGLETGTYSVLQAGTEVPRLS